MTWPQLRMLAPVFALITQMAGLLFALFSCLPSQYIKPSMSVINCRNGNTVINYAQIIYLLLAGRLQELAQRVCSVPIPD